MKGNRFGDFALEIRFEDDRSVIGVSGDVDVLTAPTLRAVLGAVAEGEPVGVVLDLSALTFMDASGLRVIVEGAKLLACDNAVLTVRQAPAQTRRILALSGIDGLVQVEAAAPASVAVATDDRSRTPSAEDVAVATRLRTNLAAAAGVSATDDVVDAALRLLTHLAKATIEGADGVSVSLPRHGQLTTVAASNSTVLQMDAHQYETGAGPCLSAAAEGQLFEVDSLAGEARWPNFIVRAMEEGIASILSTPLVVADRPLGALNIYSNTERAFGPHEHERAAMLAQQATAILGDARIGGDEEVGQRLVDALLVREQIAHAQGILMAQHRVDAEAAAALLHRSARSATVSVLQRASDIVAGIRPEGTSA